MALMVYVLGTFRPRRGEDDAYQLPQTWMPGRYFPASWAMAALMYAFMGLGVLAKGPVGLIVPTAVIGMFLLIMRLPTTDKTDASQSARPMWSLLHWSALVLLVVELFLFDRTVGSLKTFAWR